MILMQNSPSIVICVPGYHREGAASLGGLFAKELTRDHNAHSSDERARIEASGGVFTFVRNFTPLLNGHFPMTRAIGDVPLKRYGIIADPKITDWLSLTSKDKFLVVSSDGILHRFNDCGFTLTQLIEIMNNNDDVQGELDSDEPSQYESSDDDKSSGGDDDDNNDENINGESTSVGVYTGLFYVAYTSYCDGLGCTKC